MISQTNKTTSYILAILALSWISLPGLTDEAALYDLAPADSAFLRIINLRSDQSVAAHADAIASKNALMLDIENKRLSTAGYCSASEFIYLPAGTTEQKINGIPWKGSLQANKAYSLLISDKSATLLEDYRAEDSRRGMLVVYNFSDYPRVSVQTAQSARSVLAHIPAGASAARVINPLKSAFEIIDSDNSEGASLARTEAMIFQPGIMSSLFICSDQGGVFTRWADRLGAR